MADRDIQIIIQAIDKTGSAIDSINKKLSWLGGSITKLAVQFSAMSTSIQAAWSGVQKGFELAELGAKAQQVEESFQQVAASAGESAERIIAAMKRASAGTIDDTDLMQKAIKGITQGLKGDDLVKLTEGARIAARASGKDIATAFDEIVDAVANKTPRALQQMGLVTKEQMKLFNQEISSGAEVVSLLDLAVANITIRQAQFGEVTGNNLENFQRFRAELNDLKETLGKGLMGALEKVWGGFHWIGSGATASTAYIVKFLSLLPRLSAWNEGKLGNKGEADKQSQKVASMLETFEALKFSSEELAGKAMAIWSGENPAAAVAEGTKKSLPDAVAAMDALVQKMREAIEKSKIKPGKTAKPGATGRAAKEEEYPIFDAEKGMRAFREYEQSLTAIRATEVEKRLAKTEEWAEREYGLLKVAYANNVIGEKEYSDRLLEIQSEAENQKVQIKAQAAAEAAEINRKALEDEAKAAAEAAEINRKALEDEAKAAAKAAEAYKEEHGTMWEGIVEGMQRYNAAMKKNFESGRDMANNITADMESAFISFFDTTSQKFMDFGELAKSILNSIYMELVKTLVIKQIMAGISGMFHEGGVVMHQGGLVMHSGGYVVPRYHMGTLAADERPAILQTGEGVLSRRGMANLGALNSGMAGGGTNLKVEIINQSSAPVQGKQGPIKFDGKQLVTSIILSDLDSYGPIRNAFAGIK